MNSIKTEFFVDKQDFVIIKEGVEGVVVLDLRRLKNIYFDERYYGQQTLSIVLLKCRYQFLYTFSCI